MPAREGRGSWLFCGLVQRAQKAFKKQGGKECSGHTLSPGFWLVESLGGMWVVWKVNW